jgi:hypothetical protein
MHQARPRQVMQAQGRWPRPRGAGPINVVPRSQEGLRAGVFGRRGAKATPTPTYCNPLHRDRTEAAKYRPTPAEHRDIPNEFEKEPFHLTNGRDSLRDTTTHPFVLTISARIIWRRPHRDRRFARLARLVAQQRQAIGRLTPITSRSVQASAARTFERIVRSGAGFGSANPLFPEPLGAHFAPPLLDTSGWALFAKRRGSPNRAQFLAQRSDSTSGFQRLNAARFCAYKPHLPTFRRFRGSSAVEQSAVNRSVLGSNPSPGATAFSVRPGHIGDGTYLRHG